MVANILYSRMNEHILKHYFTKKNNPNENHTKKTKISTTNVQTVSDVNPSSVQKKNYELTIYKWTNININSK